MKRILVVEDDLALSAGLCFELDAAGYTAIPAYNCAKARHLFQQEQQLALALLDVNLPDGSGFALCRELKEERPELPVIFLTANDLEQDVLTGFDMGAEDYVTKPFNMQILLKRLEVALRRVEQQPSPAADRWTDGTLVLDFSALTAQRGQEKLVITPNEYKPAQAFHRPSRPDLDPAAAARPPVGQRGQLHRRPHPDGDDESPAGQD